MAGPGDELVEVTVVVPVEAAPHLEPALGFAIPDVEVRILPVDRAVSSALGVPLPVRVAEWRDGGLTWSGEPSGSRTVLAPRSSLAEAEQRARQEDVEIMTLAVEELLEKVARQTAPPSAAEPEPVVVDDDVQFTVYRPRAVRPEATEQLVAFAHKSEEYDEDGQLVDPLEEVVRQAEEVLGDLSRHVTSVRDSDVPIARGDTLRFVPVVEGIEFNPSALEFLWLRGVHREVFEFRAPRHLDGQTLSGRLSVYRGMVLVADVTLRLRIDASAAGPAQERSRGRVYGKVFPSYSHEDGVVVAQIAAAARTLGHEYLRDIELLRAGQDWQRELERYIDEADVFQLFWSPASMVSPHVRKEWGYALSLDRPDFVRPVFWHTPRPSAPPELPPPELDRLHFAYLGAAEQPSPAPVPLAPTSLPPTGAAPEGAGGRRGLRVAVAGLGTAAVAAVAVTIGVTSGSTPSASPPPVSTSTPTTIVSGTPTANESTPSPDPSSSTPPDLAAAAAVVVGFFAALDAADVDAALALVCTEREAEFEGVIAQLTRFRWSAPEVVGDEALGEGRVLVVRVTRSRGQESEQGRVAVTVVGDGGAPRVCDLADA